MKNLIEKIQELRNEVKPQLTSDRSPKNRIISIILTKLEEAELWYNAIENDQDFRRQAIVKTKIEEAELFVTKI